MGTNCGDGIFPVGIELSSIVNDCGHVGIDLPMWGKLLDFKVMANFSLV